MDDIRDYNVALINSFENGTLVTYVDPGDPIDISGDITQADINFLKRLRKEIGERFNVP